MSFQTPRRSRRFDRISILQKGEIVKRKRSLRSYIPAGGGSYICGEAASDIRGGAASYMFFRLWAEERCGRDFPPLGGKSSLFKVWSVESEEWRVELNTFPPFCEKAMPTKRAMRRRREQTARQMIAAQTGYTSSRSAQYQSANDTHSPNP